MAQHTLAEAWLWGGKIYGPGVVEIPDDLVARLTERGVLGGQATPADAPTSTDPLADFPQLAGLTPDQVRGMSDEDLMAVDGVGKATLAKIRQAVA